MARYLLRAPPGGRLSNVLEGRPDVTGDGVPFYSGLVADAYLRRTNVQRGLSVVIWRGRHVAEPTDLEEHEAAQYWREVLTIGRAL